MGHPGTAEVTRKGGHVYILILCHVFESTRGKIVVCRGTAFIAKRSSAIKVVGKSSEVERRQRVVAGLIRDLLELLTTVNSHPSMRPGRRRGGKACEPDRRLDQ